MSQIFEGNVNPVSHTYDLADGGRVWVAGTGVAALTSDNFHFQKEAPHHAAKIGEQLQQGIDATKAFGFISRRISLGSISSVSEIPGANILLVRGGMLTEAITIESIDPKSRADMFERLYNTIGGGAKIETAKANPNDVPFSPKAGMGILFALIGVGSIVAGSLSDTFFGLNLPGVIGKLLGPIASFGIGAIALIAASIALFFWWKGLPEKRTFKVG